MFLMILCCVQISLEDIAAWHEQQGSSFSISEQPQRRQPAAVPEDDSSDDSSSSDGPRDWKGDPMKLNPGGPGASRHAGSNVTTRACMLAALLLHSQPAYAMKTAWLSLHGTCGARCCCCSCWCLMRHATKGACLGCSAAQQPTLLVVLIHCSALTHDDCTAAASVAT